MIKKIFAILIWVVVLIGMAYYILSHAQEIKRLVNFSAIDIFAIALLFFFSQLVNGLRLMFILRKSRVELNVRECFHLATINALINYLPLKGGAFAVAFYLKSKHYLPYTSFIKLSIASQLVVFLTAVPVSVLFLALHYLSTGVFFARLFFIFIAVFILAIAGLFLLRPLSKAIDYNNKFCNKIKEVLDGLLMVFKDKRLLSNLTLLSILSALIMGLRFAIEFKMLSFKIAPSLPFVIGQAKTITMLVSIIPSGLGLAELAAGGISEMMSLGIDIGIYAAGIDRVVTLFALVAMSFASFIYVRRDKKIKLAVKK